MDGVHTFSAHDPSGRCATLQTTPCMRPCRPVHALLMDAAKTLLSTFYTYAGRYDQDPAYTLLHIPGLQTAKTLAVLEPGSDEAGFMATTVLREMNRINHILDDATCTLDRALRLISG